MAASSAASLAASAARSVRGVADMSSTLPARNPSGPAGKQLSDAVVRVAGSVSAIVRSPRVESVDHAFYERARLSRTPRLRHRRDGRSRPIASS